MPAPRKQPVRTRPPEEGAPPALLPALQEVIALLPPGEDQRRLAAVFGAAVVAIEALGELDFSDYEREEIGSADLSVWEALAPVIRDTIVDVNALLNVVKQEIPELAPDAPAAPAEADVALDDFFGEPAKVAPSPGPGVADPQRKVREAEEIILAIASSLAREVTAFGEGIRKPVVMADRWNLLSHLGEFRGKFRAGIGEMVFLGASAFAPVRKDHVVPFYQEETREAVTLRRTLTVLSGVVRAENAKLQLEEPPEARLRALRLLRDLETFRTSSAYPLLRPGDKRSFIKSRAELLALANDPGSKPKAMKLSVEGLDKFLDSLSVINRRETLIVHDREALAAAALCLERSEAAVVAGDLPRARLHCTGAAGAGQRLYGRDRELDTVLRGLRKIDIATLGLPQLRKLGELIRFRIAAVPAP